jgi:hypothetical protein
MTSPSTACLSFLTGSPNTESSLLRKARSRRLSSLASMAFKVPARQHWYELPNELFVLHVYDEHIESSYTTISPTSKSACSYDVIFKLRR